MKWRPRWWPEYYHAPMPSQFYELATYNGEVGRGVVHTPEYVARMSRLQAEYNLWAAQVFEGMTARTPGPG